MKGLVRPDILAMHAYEEEATGGLNLMGNTNLFGPNPALERAFAKVRTDQLSEYPSLTSAMLRAAVARRHGVDEAQVVTGNGSNELIDVVMRTFLAPGDVVAFASPTFSMVPTFVRANHGTPVAVPLGDAWDLDARRLLEVPAKITFVCRPNNPTGNAFARKDVERIVREATGIVVVDEAYVEFLGGESFVQEIRGGAERLVVLRTMSKAHGLAGLRVGFAIAGMEAAREMAKVRGPFRLNTVSETAAALALSDERFLETVVAGVKSERPNLARMLEERGFMVFPSDANFVLVKPPVDAARLAEALAHHGVWVRDFGGPLAPYLRITVGPPAATARLQHALDKALPPLGREAGA